MLPALNTQTSPGCWNAVKLRGAPVDGLTGWDKDRIVALSSTSSGAESYIEKALAVGSLSKPGPSRTCGGSKEEFMTLAPRVATVLSGTVALLTPLAVAHTRRRSAYRTAGLSPGHDPQRRSGGKARLALLVQFAP
jgi:hypothetical protein